MSGGERRKRAVAELETRRASATGSTTSRASSPAVSSSAWPSRAHSSTSPSIVLADEPTGNLDSHSGIEVMSMLQELEQHGITVVLVTHDANIARHAQRVVEIADGKIVSDEPVDDRLWARDRMAELGGRGRGGPRRPRETARAKATSARGAARAKAS